MTNTTEEDSKARSRTFFKGINHKQHFSTSGEWHAFLIGFFEVLCPWPPKIPVPSPQSPVSTEYHYYLGGRASGVLAWLAIAKLIQVVFF